MERWFLKLEKQQILEKIQFRVYPELGRSYFSSKETLWSQGPGRERERKHPWSSHRNILLWAHSNRGCLAPGNLRSVLHPKGQAPTESSQSLCWRQPCHSRLDASGWRLSPAPAILTAVEDGTQVPSSQGCQVVWQKPFCWRSNSHSRFPSACPS